MTIATPSVGGNPDWQIYQNSYRNVIASGSLSVPASGSLTAGPYYVASASGVELNLNLTSGSAWNLRVQWTDGNTPVTISNDYADESITGDAPTVFTQNFPVQSNWVYLTFTNFNSTTAQLATFFLNATAKASRGPANVSGDGVAITLNNVSQPVGTTRNYASTYSPGWYQYYYRIRSALTGTVTLAGTYLNNVIAGYLALYNPAANAIGSGYLLVGNYMPQLIVANTGSSAVAIDFTLIAVSF